MASTKSQMLNHNRKNIIRLFVCLFC